MIDGMKVFDSASKDTNDTFFKNDCEMLFFYDRKGDFRDGYIGRVHWVICRISRNIRYTICERFYKRTMNVNKAAVLRGLRG